MKNIGCRSAVFRGKAKKTSGGLKKEDLKKNRYGRIVSVKRSESAKESSNLGKFLKPCDRPIKRAQPPKKTPKKVKPPPKKVVPQPPKKTPKASPKPPKKVKPPPKASPKPPKKKVKPPSMFDLPSPGPKKKKSLIPKKKKKVDRMDKFKAPHLQKRRKS